MARKHTTRTQYAQMFKLLEEHCEKRSDGYAAYRNDWNDKMIAAAVGASLSAVQATRVDLYGKLADPTRPGEAAEIAELRRRVTDLDLLLRETVDAHNALSLSLDSSVHLIAGLDVLKREATETPAAPYVADANDPFGR